MIKCYPSYYKNFKCIADRCHNNCCAAGWEIDIDEESIKYYKSVSGVLGDKLHKGIEITPPSHFILKPDGRCPFLNSKNLCDIYINLGEEHLCQICSEHPRFYQCFNDVIECGLGLYCEEAARIILSESTPFYTYKVETNTFVHCKYNKELYSYLRIARAKIFKYLSDTSIDIFSRIKDIVWYAHTLQQNIDFNMMDNEEIFSVTNYSKSDISFIFDFLRTLIPNDQNWPNYLKDCKQIIKENQNEFSKFIVETHELEKYLENISTYFIYRYFLDAVYDEDALSKVKFMAISVAALHSMFFCKWLEKNSLSLTDCIFIVQKFSEEIECNDDNILKIYNSTYELNEFSTEKILGLF
ncbi:MAG: flagellin lysine-N-methylase [Clostridia bacterium]|nr:flagellin lysine-N-methylase [Clostridia bacterium]